MNSNVGQLHSDERRRMDEQSLGSILFYSRMIALAMTMREGRITFANPAFMRCSNHPTRWTVQGSRTL
jgi:hypothetical protein